MVTLDSDKLRMSVEACGIEKTTTSAYRLTLISRSRSYEFMLPSIREGADSFYVEGESLISCVASDGAWYMSGASAVMLDKSNNRITFAKVVDGGFWYIAHAGNRSILIAEALTLANFGYVRYRIRESVQLSIGRMNDNDITFFNPYISKRHALVVYKQGSFRVEDVDSTNGVYVNNQRITSQELKLGDIVDILGLRLVIGTDFLAINSKKNGVNISSRYIEGYVPTMPMDLLAVANNTDHKRSDLYFNRLPRRRTPLKTTDIEIEMPPFPINDKSIPLMLRMGGSAVYGAASAFMGNPLMLLSTILFPFLSEKYTEKQRAEYEERRVSAYSRYLRQKARAIEREKEYEELVLRENYPSINTVFDLAMNSRRLWERRKEDDDFLKIRVGVGELPMIAKVVYPEKKLSLEDDELENKMYELANRQVILRNVPIVVDFVKYNFCGITGDYAARIEFVRRLIARLAALYSYDELKIVLLAQPQDVEELKFVKYLPHFWNDQRTMRFIGTNQGEAYLIGEMLSREIEEDLSVCRQLNSILREHPYYFVVALDKLLQDCVEVLKSCAQLDDNCGLTSISAFNDIPKDCAVQIALSNSGEHSIINIRDIEEPVGNFALDDIDKTMFAACMSKVANTTLKAVDATYSLSKSLSFLEMYDVGRISNLNILKRWEESDPVATLAVPVGVDVAGNSFNLDLHQKFQGPHGLVAGMTGSGKSEFLLTYILSLAINYRPEEVSFLLIDYKGGGLAGAFEDKARGLRLPHLAGTITNLDGSAIQRSLLSLQSEILRRQRVFNEAKSIAGESTMDIYQYQKLFRQGVVIEPISHLFIISDEFAELKDQQREFLDQLISIARIGRSLGVHLILATQKPGGVVNDQILSNTKFRVCLKVQTKGDSVEMLKRPEAAELQDIGRFYLQVGYNELFALGQSAWSGAPYVPQDRATAKVDKSIEIIDEAGQKITVSKLKEPERLAEGSELSAIVAELIEIAKSVGSMAKQLWTPPLPRTIELQKLNAIEQQHSMTPIVGVLDDPERQVQAAFAMDLAKRNHFLVVGGARSGKTTLIQTMILRLLENFTSDELNLYLLDYSSRLSSMFLQFPHCGAALFEADEDKIEAFFGLIDELVTERKKQFSEMGIDSFGAACEILTMPVILVVIDNYSGFSANKKGEAYAYRMDEYLKAGAQYGIKYVISCNHPNEINIRARQEIDGRIALHAKDKYEYEEILGCRISYTPPECPGRGLCVIDERPLELQVACIGSGLDASGRSQALKDEVKKMARNRGYGNAARRLPVIDNEISYSEFCKMGKPGTFPLGYSLDNAKYVELPLKQFTPLSIYFGSQASQLPVFNNVLYMAARENMVTYMVKRVNRSLVSSLIPKEPKSTFEPLESSDEGVERLIRCLAAEMQARQQIWDEYKDQCSDSQNRRKSYDYLREMTTPWLVVFERLEDVANLTDELTQLLSSLLSKFHEFNMYAIGCFYPDDKYGLANKSLTSAFNNEELAMLFGGRYSGQKCVNLPGEYARVSDEGPFNKCLMKYRGKFYPIQMPCEESQPLFERDDDRSIFD
ncbi:type VII secretion protein EssC [Adlercreutzia sp. ZJ141]|uniref:type VII secretion protein EssC n=1 Tax=Adlercreutzia sp. ZJ141 TaxID=2709406 RepID=UPI0013EB81CA|nr:type VII secretion protein EssC [Adlercreutzia sp. ZJ141]